MSFISKYNEKIKDLLNTSHMVNIWRTKPVKVVFTNGCFDILHVGHVQYLEEAKSLGDKLIVGVNSDESIRKLKGAERPINHEMDRAMVLAALGFVDVVVIFSEDTPANLIHTLKPDVLVKGGDWPVEKIVGSDFVIKNGGQVISLPFREGHSTTSTIDKIKRLG